MHGRLERVDSRFEAALKRMGVESLEAYIDPETPTCFGLYPRRTIDLFGRRCSTYHAFLPKSLVRQRSNLTICLGCNVQRILFSDDDAGLTATSVLVEGEGKKLFLVRAKHEIILSAGAIVTPQLLLLRYILIVDVVNMLMAAAWDRKTICETLGYLAFTIFQVLVPHWSQTSLSCLMNSKTTFMFP